MGVDDDAVHGGAGDPARGFIPGFGLLGAGTAPSQGMWPELAGDLFVANRKKKKKKKERKNLKSWLAGYLIKLNNIKDQMKISWS
ncbi:hypothetical protein J5N97_024664 [Dioscorea zingiberensis]|uniref:Uncharacterized protein n=1 Tax=Dioscorea zingiberensis TaxID=325984 RepID=A0A9D5C6V0_9LILI|nr:hypothetical protein J5N97_024664 [Dioscorea zingiberensis]